MCSFILRQRRLQISLHGFLICRVKSCRQISIYTYTMNRSNSSTIKDMKYLSTKMNYIDMITTRTKFQLDPKKRRDFKLLNLYGIVRDETLVPIIVLVCKYFWSELEALISELILKRAFRRCILLPPPCCGF